MKTEVLLCLIFSMTWITCSPGDSGNEALELFTENLGYNEKLAELLDADEYGMSTYVIAFLKTGPNRDQDSLTAVKLQKAHMDNIQRMAEQGELVLAGPFLDNGELRGIYIFNVTSLEEAKKLTETDPAIQAGRLAMELHPWYGSAVLKKLNHFHKAVEKTSF